MRKMWRFPVKVRMCAWSMLAVAICGVQLYAQSCIVPHVVTDTVVVTPADRNVTGQPLKMIAFGTSLMWGNGLKGPHTFRYLVAESVAEKSGRPVALTTFAHSAALLGVPQPGADLEGDSNWDVGDLNYSLPAVHQQIDCAAGLPETKDADLILMDGCINEVGAESIPLPWTDPNDLKQRTESACGALMRVELTHLAQMYPQSMTVVVGYYPLVSDRSITGWFRGTEKLKRHAKKVYAARHPSQTQPSDPKLSKKERQKKMKDNSEIFYKTSKHEISAAVDYVDNNVLHTKQMIFAPLPEVTLPDGTRTVDPDFAFGAPEHQLWWIPIPILWHWAFFADEKYGIRHDECNKYVTKLEEKLICPINNAFHPNVPGAKMYADSIVKVIPPDALDRWKAVAEQTANSK
jgi:hypothetical protein